MLSLLVTISSPVTPAIFVLLLLAILTLSLLVTVTSPLAATWRESLYSLSSLVTVTSPLTATWRIHLRAIFVALQVAILCHVQHLL